MTVAAGAAPGASADRKAATTTLLNFMAHSPNRAALFLLALRRDNHRINNRDTYSVADNTSNPFDKLKHINTLCYSIDAVFLRTHFTLADPVRVRRGRSSAAIDLSPPRTTPHPDKPACCPALEYIQPTG
jgi:hypothetical protein